MNDDMELRQIVYDVIKTQIQFGAYRYGDTLPSMEQAAGHFLVSLDTARAAYLKLSKEGYVTLTQNTGSTVIKNYESSEIRQNIVQFFAPRKTALIDLSQSLRPLLSHAQWLGLKHAPPQVYSQMRQQKALHTASVFDSFDHIMQAYESLGNSLLLRLVWQIFMFFEAPFYSVPENPWSSYASQDYALRSLDLCINQDWEALRASIDDMQSSMYRALIHFYEERVTGPRCPQELPFHWSSYKKASQICYTLAVDLLIAISRGYYPENSLLPSLHKLSNEKKVSVSTVRRALSLLNSIGAVKSVKRIGTRVLPLDETTLHCDISSPAVRKRLMDMARSLHILTLSCRDVAELTLPALDEAGIHKYAVRLDILKDHQQYELIAYATLELLNENAPYQAIRTVYTELIQQLFWGYSLRSISMMNKNASGFYASCMDTFINALEEERKTAIFSKKLEELMIHELTLVIDCLNRLGITEAKELRIPDGRVSI